MMKSFTVAMTLLDADVMDELLEEELSVRWCDDAMLINLFMSQCCYYSNFRNNDMK